MKKIFLLITVLIANGNLFSQETFQYISPLKDSKLVSLNSTIILGAKDNIDFSTVKESTIIVTGNKSGVHKGKVKLSDDKKTLIFIPTKQFEPNEKVSVNISTGIKTVDGEELASVSYQFTTTPLSKPIVLNPFSTIMGDKLNDIDLINKNSGNAIKKVDLETDSLPSDFPPITIDTVNNPAPGKIFLANFGFGGSLGYFLMIVNNDGTVENYKRLSGSGLDFKVQPNGNLSYSEVIQITGGAWQSRFIILDTTLAPIDTFQCGNGYVADVHDFKLLPNGHAILIATDPEPIDMSLYGGDPNATVLGCIVQELDASKNVIFQWRSWDYIPITDSYLDLTGRTVDYFHQNAVDADHDGNFLLSSRNLSQIIKIDRNTGNIIWKLGGKDNDFIFINEHEENSPNYFSYQHDIAVSSNGNITLFDNGNQHPTPYSRAVEYKLDQVNKTAELVWDYRHSPDIFANAMGSAQRLPNGNTLIGWGSAGGAGGNPTVTEVHPDKSVAIELSLPQTSYRAFRFPWKSQLPEKSVTQYEILQGNTYTFDEPDDTTGITIKFNQLDGFIYNSVTATVFRYAPTDAMFNGDAPKVAMQYFTLSGAAINSFEGTVTLKMQYFPLVTDPSERIIYSRTNSSNNFEPLPTSYDSAKNEITFTATNFGDFIFCKPLSVDSAYSPILIEPLDEEMVNVEDTVKLVWGTRGIVSDYSLQVSLDSLFTNLIVDQTLSTTSYQIDNLNNNSKYFWRVSATNSSGESKWSEPYSFITSSPFITVTYPNGNDSLYTDSTYIIRWNDNLTGMVRIDLLRNDAVTSIIANSLLSETNAYKWDVPSGLEIDSSYKIRITDINDENLFDLSDNTFVINQGTVGVSEPKNIVKEYKLFQNYPNPFNPSTVIEYVLPVESNVTISVFNTIGQRVAVLLDRTQGAGNHSISWNAQNLSSGVYFYKIEAVGFNKKDNFVSYKKAILIK